TITARFVEVTAVPDGIANGTYDSYVNQRGTLYYKNMVFTLTSADGTAANYKIKVANCTATENDTTISVQDSRLGESANNTVYTFTITPLNLRGDYTNTIQSYRAAGGVSNTTWNDVGFTSRTALFTSDWNEGLVYPVISQAWQQGEDPINNPGVYTKYSIVTGNLINDVTVGPYETEDLLKFSLQGGALDGGKCIYNYSYTFAQPRLVIGYFISDEETGARVDSLAALMLVDFYYSSGDYTTFTQTEDISGILTLDDYNTLLESEHPGMAEYLQGQSIGSNVEFMPIGIDLDGSFSGEFNGRFNGAGYTINGINIVLAGNSDQTVGLFSVIGKEGIVKNVHVRNAIYTCYTEPVYDDQSGEVTYLPNSYVGGIAGRNKGYIYNSSFYGIIDVGIDPSFGNIAVAGGIAGDNLGIIENVVAVGEIKSNSAICYVGGIAGTHAYNYTENQYIYTDGVAPTSPTSTSVLSTNKIMNALSFMDIRVTAVSLAQAVTGGIVGRAITATGRGDIDGDDETYTYVTSNYAVSDSAIYNTAEPTVPDIVYLSNSILVRVSTDIFMYGEWSIVSRRTGNSTSNATAGKDYNYMRKIGDEMQNSIMTEVAASGYESYLRFVAKGKNVSNEPEILDDLYYMLIDIIDVYVIQADQVGTNAAYERYRYASATQKVYDAYFYDADAEGGAAVYSYELDTSSSLPLVYLYDASVLSTLYVRMNATTFITLGALLELEDLTETYYVTVEGIKYLKPTVGLFAKYTTPTGATYTATAGGTVSSEFTITHNSKVALLANYRFATFVVSADVTVSTTYEGGFYGYIKSTGTTEDKIVITLASGVDSIFEYFNATTSLQSTTTTISG
ncbi:MAG: hypothetical protein PHE93_06520, partial [Clostridia bacterium]|nr:hypothetical protein [Clostridia bacterium]